MNFKLPFRKLEPVAYGGLMDDPLILVKINGLGESLLLDCGSMQHMAKRVVKSVTALLITHAHMDHWQGVDRFTRSILVSPRDVLLFGPPGIAQKLACKLMGYDWNLVEDNYCRFQVTEIHPEHLASFRLEGAKGFALEPGEIKPRQGPIWETPHLEVQAELCDHKIPSLAYLIKEKEPFVIDQERLEKAGYVTGPWISQIKEEFQHPEANPETPLWVEQKKNGKLERRLITDRQALYAEIKGETRQASLGYMTDLGWTKPNQEKIFRLFEGVDFLITECSYKAQDEPRARSCFHLCTKDINQLAARLKPKFLLPLHFSKLYLGEAHQVLQELTPPPGCILLTLPERLTGEPLLPNQVKPWLTTFPPEP